MGPGDQHCHVVRSSEWWTLPNIALKPSLTCAWEIIPPKSSVLCCVLAPLLAISLKTLALLSMPSMLPSPSWHGNRESMAHSMFWLSGFTPTGCFCLTAPDLQEGQEGMCLLANAGAEQSQHVHHLMEFSPPIITKRQTQSRPPGWACTFLRTGRIARKALVMWLRLRRLGVQHPDLRKLSQHLANEREKKCVPLEELSSTWL